MVRGEKGMVEPTKSLLGGGQTNFGQNLLGAAEDLSVNSFSSQLNNLFAKRGLGRVKRSFVSA